MPYLKSSKLNHSQSKDQLNKREYNFIGRTTGGGGGLKNIVTKNRNYMATQKAKIVPIQIQKPNKDISKQVLTFSPSKIIFKVDQTKKEKS